MQMRLMNQRVSQEALGVFTTGRRLLACRRERKKNHTEPSVGTGEARLGESTRWRCQGGSRTRPRSRRQGVWRGAFTAT